ncbi:hypothetical protein C8Q80DRAFT_1119067 [Daedaleopsis nitida]|nr:hypothetical protein C8Q80DRAFT_1119067 [Daedaleopsis nitida]
MSFLQGYTSGVASAARGWMRAATGGLALQSRRQPMVCIRQRRWPAHPTPPELGSSEDGEEREKKKSLQNPRNEAIPHKLVRFVNPETKTLEPPRPLSAVLAFVDRKRQYLELVAERPEPIVKLIDVKDRYDRNRARRVQQVLGRAPEEKELQLTWGVAAGDLAFKLRKAREDLVDGDRVSLVFAPKKGQAVLNDQERTRAVDEALRLLEDVGRERKERTVQGQAVALHLEPLRQKQVHELKWAYAVGGEPFNGAGNVAAALKSGVRVDAVRSRPT